LRDESGTTAIEYGLIALLVAVGILGVVATTGNLVRGFFENVVAAITGL
jgi:Flp pilus assembly pilin Flp